MESEKQIQNEIIRQYGTRPDLRIWRANTGVADMGGRTVAFGLPGQADLSGILMDGRRLEIEVKSATGTLSERQRQFRDMIERFNGVYIVARCVEDVRKALAEEGY